MESVNEGERKQETGRGHVRFDSGTSDECVLFIRNGLVIMNKCEIESREFSIAFLMNGERNDFFLLCRNYSYASMNVSEEQKGTDE